MSDAEKKKKVLSFLDAHGIAYRSYDHPAFFTVADAHAYKETHGGVFHDPRAIGCKNLFLKTQPEAKLRAVSAGNSLAEEGEQYRYYLYVLPDTARADLKAFAKAVGEKKVTFGTPEELMHYLGVTPGSVSLCGLLNDTNAVVKVYLDPAVDAAPLIHLHPNINTMSLELTHEAFMQFRGALLQEIKICEICTEIV